MMDDMTFAELKRRVIAELMRRVETGDADDITDLMGRARSGDPVAIQEFLSRFEPVVRMMVRARLAKKLCTQFDPIQEADAADLMRKLTGDRSPQEARIIELRMQGYTFKEIAEHVGLHERKVRRIIEMIHRRIEAD
jgi:DNA-binding NarL/FixJ family response regulator